MLYAVEMTPDDMVFTYQVSHGMIFIQSFMKICAGVQAILRFCFRNLRGCNVGITDGRDL
jgi:hypothetical protein